MLLYCSITVLYRPAGRGPRAGARRRGPERHRLHALPEGHRALRRGPATTTTTTNNNNNNTNNNDNDNNKLHNTTTINNSTVNDKC